MNKSILFANSYVEQRSKTVNKQFRPLFHMTPKCGWINDPNGLILIGDTYHLYYQANPFESRPGKMLWGHFVSKDLISYEDAGIALLPEGDGENAFSGGAIEVDNKINIYYTLHIDKRDQLEKIFDDANNKLEKRPLNEMENEKLKTVVKEDNQLRSEEVYYAVSNDGGISFEENQKVFDNETLPKHLSRIDFRDPCPVKVGDYYYVLIGAKNIEKNAGEIVLLRGKTPTKLEYFAEFGPYYELGDMGECPSYYKVGSKDVIVVSGCNVQKRGNSFKNINSSSFIVGKIDFEKGKFDVEYIREIDKGDSFYAPQFIRGAKEPIMVGWQEMWGKDYPTHKYRHGWAGTFAIPRVLKEVDGEIYQYPVDSFFNYLGKKHERHIPKHCYIKFECNGEGSLVIRGDNGRFIVGNNSLGVYTDNTLANTLYNTIRNTDNKYDHAVVEMIIDASCVEVFVNKGKECISTKMYLTGTMYYDVFGEISNLEIYELGGAL